MVNDNNITCQEFVEMVTDYLENVLLPQARKQFEEHAGQCSGCQTYLEQIQQTITMLRDVAEEPTTPETKQKLLQVFHRLRHE